MSVGRSMMVVEDQHRTDDTRCHHEHDTIEIGSYFGEWIE